MKKLLLTFSLAAMLLSAKAQIVITGIMYDPRGTDAFTAGTAIGDYTSKGGFEYAQFRATQTIDFSVTPYSVVFCRNPNATVTTLQNGWAAGGDRTYKMDLTSGVVQKGDIFYVGGLDKKLAGYVTISGVTYLTEDMGSSKWIKAVDYATSPGDGGIGSATTALLPNSGNPGGVAVFVGTTVTSTTVPLDVAFFSGTNPITSVTSVYNSTNQWGYLVPNNDFYSTSDTFFGKGSNTKTFVYPMGTANAVNNGGFLKLGGDYNTSTNTWNVPRSSTTLVLFANGTQADASAFTVSAIETDITTLPVSLTNFTAKANKQGSINLAWSTASEQNNSHFEITRSADGKAFSKIDQVAGANNSSSIKNYSYTDANPIAGVNYYQLKQVDFDGTSALSKVVSAKAGLGTNNLTVAISANKSSIKANYNALSSGKATFAVYTVSGAKVSSVEQNVTAGNNQVDLAVSLGNSLHILKVTQGTESISVKF
ncbi:hypothetical protein ACQKCH_04220 [Nubsella zeaxanthinifaciens]|uniref:hypothetical protein n=1 Tax=Nubsella zeaxanthinifaciens TaxID=392412 RepID=UPI003D0165A0